MNFRPLIILAFLAMPVLVLAAVNWQEAPATLKALGCVDELSCEAAYNKTTDPDKLKAFWEFADRQGVYDKEQQQVLKTTLDILVDELKELQQLTDPAELKRRILALAKKIEEEDPDSARRLIDKKKIKEAEDEEEGEQAIRDGKVKPCAEAGATDPDACGQLLLKAALNNDQEVLAQFRAAAVRYFHMTAGEFDEMVKRMKQEGQMPGEDEDEIGGGLITIYLPPDLQEKYGQKMTFKSKEEAEEFFRKVEKEKRDDRGILPDIGKRDREKEKAMKEMVAQCVRDTGRPETECQRLVTEYLTDPSGYCPVAAMSPLPSPDCYYGDRMFLSGGPKGQALCSFPRPVCPGDEGYDKEFGKGGGICPAMPTVACGPDEEPDKYLDVPGCGRYVTSCKKRTAIICPAVMPYHCSEEEKRKDIGPCPVCIKEEPGVKVVEFPYTFSGPGHLLVSQRTVRTGEEADKYCRFYGTQGSGYGLAAECEWLLSSIKLSPEIPKEPVACAAYRGYYPPYTIETTDKSVSRLVYERIEDVLANCGLYQNILTTGSKSLCAALGACTTETKPPPPIPGEEIHRKFSQCMTGSGEPLPLRRGGKSYSNIAETEALANELPSGDSLETVIRACIRVSQDLPPTPRKGEKTTLPGQTTVKGQKNTCWNSYGLCSSILDTDDPNYLALVAEARQECGFAPSWAPRIWRDGAGDPNNKKAFGLPNIDECRKYTSPPSVITPPTPMPGSGDQGGGGGLITPGRAYRGGLYYSTAFRSCMTAYASGAAVDKIISDLNANKIPPSWDQFTPKEQGDIASCESGIYGGGGGGTSQTTCDRYDGEGKAAECTAVPGCQWLGPPYYCSAGGYGGGGGGGGVVGACTDPAIKALFTTGAEGAHQMSDPDLCFNGPMSEYIRISSRGWGSCTGQNQPVNGCSAIATGGGGGSAACNYNYVCEPGESTGSCPADCGSYTGVTGGVTQALCDQYDPPSGAEASCRAAGCDWFLLSPGNYTCTPPSGGGGGTAGGATFSNCPTDIAALLGTGCHLMYTSSTGENRYCNGDMNQSVNGPNPGVVNPGCSPFSASAYQPNLLAQLINLLRSLFGR